MALPSIAPIQRPIDGEVPTVDYELNLYDLTTLFFSYYRYHNDECSVSFQDWSYVQDPQKKNWTINPIQRTLSRFQVLRRIQACKLSSRPFIGNQEVAPHKPNINLGYLSMLLRYVALPYKSVTSEKDITKITFDRKLKEAVTYSGAQKEKQKLQEANNPNIFSNSAISEDTSNYFNQLLARSTPMQNTATRSATDVIQNGFAAFLHADPGWTAEPIEALDLVFQPQAYWDTRSWSDFFILRTMKAQEAVQHIRNNTPFWDIDALRWALETSQAGRSVFRNYYNQTPYTQLGQDNTPLCGENFMVKSFYADKAYRSQNLQGYYGNLLVAEGYYKNTKGNIQKVVFFPSWDFYDTPANERVDRLTDEEKNNRGLSGAGVLFSRELPRKKKSMWDVLSIIPFDRSEPTLERQRSYGHELFNPVDIIMRTDTNILNLVALMGSIFVKNRNEGSSPQNVQDLSIELNGSIQDIGDRELLEQPFTHDLNAMLAVRGMLVAHAMSKSYLSGLDNVESMGEGRGADFAKYRLVRDGRIHKHDVDDFGKGQSELYSKVLRAVIDELNETEATMDRMVKTLFYYPLIKQLEYDEDLFEFEDDEVLEDNALPYWMSVTAVRNGASHMGAAEMVLYSEIKQVFGDGFTKTQLDKLNYMGIKSILGPQDAVDILGNPQDTMNTDEDQQHDAQMENASILGSVSNGLLNFEPISVRMSKDDPMAHLGVHNPKAMEIIEMLDSAQVTPEVMDGMTEEQLDTRVNLILRVAALANHMTQHMEQLEFFGDARPDVNELKEQTNAIIQSSEGLLNSLQINLRALQAKREDTMLRLQNLSPENEAAKAQAQADMMKTQAEMRRDDGKLALANAIREDAKKMHMDKQVTAARDRAQRDRQAEAANRAKEMDAASKAQMRELETSANIRNKAVESNVSTQLKLSDSNISTATKIRDSQINSRAKQREADQKVKNMQREADVKVETTKKLAEAKIAAQKKQALNGPSKQG